MKSRSAGQLLRPLACALAVAALSLVLQLATPAASKALLAPGGIRTSKAPAGAGTPVARLPDRPANVPWVLRADRLVLHGSAFRGVVTVRAASGAQRVLKFTARSLDFGDLDLTAGRGRAAMRLRAKPATTSTVQGKDVTLYTQKLSGTLVGLGGEPLPADRSVTVTPDALPPWLSHPAVPTRTITFENVTVSQVAQLSGDMSIAGPTLSVAAG
ncbi:hypothetical protein HEP84_23330 [Streptomyces sp. RLB1-33]|uniref:hypothetical protein n=1 Tax=Streptomyces mirabilis TaxID=68239 RepID=UPI00143E8FF6|nr:MULTISPECIES: hypothetical protein [Streptomyces]QIY71657.1 hypothetical protein HEP84_23330 [Streptomyces sp. RLB1-33]QUW81368.1 hypothetical protein SMIR_21505 [Streptomyces mirabilis]